MTDKYDVIVIGAGSGGLSAVFLARKLKLKVALIEAEKVGGDCTWHGCVPSKALIHASKASHLSKIAHRYVHGAIETVYQHETPEALQADGDLTVILGRATFVSPNEMDIVMKDTTKGTKRVRGAKFVVCTGAGPIIPPFLKQGAPPYLTYLDVFGLTELPERLVVLGGGPIGSELAQAFARLGSQVTVFASAILAKEEDAVRETMEAVFAEEGIQVVRSRAVGAALGPGGQGVSVSAKDGTTVNADVLLVSVGRQTDNLGSLGLEAAGVAYTDRGIQVDAKLRTSAKHIAAAGDCIGGQQFTHLAAYQGFTALRNLVLPLSDKWEAASVPRVTFTEPEVGQVGLTEAENAAKWGAKARVALRPISRVDRGVCEGESRGFFKIMYREGGRITGATIVCSRAGEILNEMAVAIHAKMKMKDLAKVMHAYPTFSFDIQTMAADVVSDDAFGGRLGGIYRWLAKRAVS